MARQRLDWSRQLPERLVIPGVMTLRTLADVQKLIRHLPADVRAKDTWQHVSDELDKAARGGGDTVVSATPTGLRTNRAHRFRMTTFLRFRMTHGTMTTLLRK
jgi:hypothetical protein